MGLAAANAAARLKCIAAQLEVQAIGYFSGFLKAVFDGFSERALVLEGVFLEGNPGDRLEGDVEVEGDAVFAEFLEDIKFIAAEAGDGSAVGGGSNGASGGSGHRGHKTPGQDWKQEAVMRSCTRDVHRGLVVLAALFVEIELQGGKHCGVKINATDGWAHAGDSVSRPVIQPKNKFSASGKDRAHIADFEFTFFKLGTGKADKINFFKGHVQH